MKVRWLCVRVDPVDTFRLPAVRENTKECRGSTFLRCPSLLLKVHETPAEFAAQIKKNLLAQLSKWEIDRAALQAVVESAGDNAADAAKVRAN